MLSVRRTRRAGGSVFAPVFAVETSTVVNCPPMSSPVELRWLLHRKLTRSSRPYFPSTLSSSLMADQGPNDMGKDRNDKAGEDEMTGLTEVHFARGSYDRGLYYRASLLRSPCYYIDFRKILISVRGCRCCYLWLFSCHGND